MRLVIQRVLSASVSVAGIEISRIGAGLLILLGLHRDDNVKTVRKWAEKAVKVRLWPEIVALQESAAEQSKQQSEQQQEEQEEEVSENLSAAEKKFAHGEAGWKTCVADNQMEVLVVSQFTLYSTFKGNKPDFHDSMTADEARKLYEVFIEHMRAKYHPDKVKGGKFQEYMHVSLVNDGPVTIIVDDGPEENVTQNAEKKKAKGESKQQQLLLQEGQKQKNKQEDKKNKKIEEGNGAVQQVQEEEQKSEEPVVKN